MENFLYISTRDLQREFKKMSFLVLHITNQTNKMLLSQKQYEQVSASRTLEKVNDKLSDLESSCKSNANLKNNSYYKELAAYSTAYETKVANLDTEIKLLENQIKSFDSAITENVKESTSFWCLG